MKFTFSTFCRKSILLVLLVSSCLVKAQDIKINKIVRLGLNYGIGSQSNFPCGNPNYLHESSFFKAQINYHLKKKKKWDIELNIEPSVYFIKHQLLNFWFIGPDRGDDYLAQRDRFTQLINYNEYTLNIGIMPRYYILKNVSVYVMASIGPMISTNDTERLKKGFAFSDIAAVGTSYEIGRVRLDFRFSLRHASNAGLSNPNNGHNNACTETGISIKI